MCKLKTCVLDGGICRRTQDEDCKYAPKFNKTSGLKSVKWNSCTMPFRRRRFSYAVFGDRP